MTENLYNRVSHHIKIIQNENKFSKKSATNRGRSKSSQNSEEEAMTGYIYNSATNHCDDVKVECSTTIGLPCTVNENGIEKDVFELRDLSETSCSIPLYRQ